MFVGFLRVRATTQSCVPPTLAAQNSLNYNKKCTFLYFSFVAISDLGKRRLPRDGDMTEVDDKSQVPLVSVGFILIPEFTLSALAGFADTMRLSADDSFKSQQKYCAWTIMGVDGKSVKSSCGAEVAPWEPLRYPIDLDCVVVIGGLVEGHSGIDPRILEYLRQAHNQGCVIAGLCTGSFALAYAGLMEHRTTCVHWFHKPDFERAFPNLRCVTDTVFYKDGNCWTCAGGGVAHDVAAHVIEQYCGRARAQIGASGMLMTSTQGYRSPQPHLEADWFQDIADAHLRRAILVMDQNIRHPLTIAELAAKAQMSKYRLQRLFQKHLTVSAARFFRALRLAHANKEVLYTRRQFTNIAAEFGFSDASHFSKCFAETFQLTPSDARALPIEAALSKMRVAVKSAPVVVASMLEGHLFFSSQIDDLGPSGRNILKDDPVSTDAHQ